MTASLRFTTANQHQLLQAAADATYSIGFMGDADAIAAIDHTGDILAIGVFQNQTLTQAEMHFAINTHRMLRRDVLKTMATYAFKVKGIKRLIAPIPGWNTRAQVFALRTGWVISGIVRAGAIDGSDAIIMTLTEDTFRRFDAPKPPMPADKAAEEME